MSRESEIARAKRQRRALSAAEATAILVIGDSMLDRYIWGSVDRISPEAPVPVIRKSEQTARPGGAANVALNVVGLGASVSLVSIIGRDSSGDQLLRVLDQSNITTDFVCASALLATTTKTRIITGHQHVLRVDEDPLGGPLLNDLVDQVVRQVNRAIAERPDAIILSDYRKGVLGEEVCDQVVLTAREMGIPVFIDPKGTDYRRYSHANVLTPNLLELELATGIDRKDVDALIDAGRDLSKSLKLDALVLTRGADGLTKIDESGTLHSPAQVQEVFDVTGAGDTVIAALALARASGLDWPDSLHLANVAAGLVVRRRGAVPVEKLELLAAIAPPKGVGATRTMSHNELCVSVDRWRRAGDRIVFTNGCFDILHAGHVRYLTAAAAEGDRLVVAINDDRSTRSLKGTGRPINGERDRAEVIGALKSVDAVALFSDPTPLDLIRRLRPDVLVKGGDYADKKVVGAAEVESWGGRVFLAPYENGLSTTGLIEKMRQ